MLFNLMFALLGAIFAVVLALAVRGTLRAVPPEKKARVMVTFVLLVASIVVAISLPHRLAGKVTVGEAIFLPVGAWLLSRLWHDIYPGDFLEDRAQ